MRSDDVSPPRLSASSLERRHRRSTSIDEMIERMDVEAARATNAALADVASKMPDLRAAVETCYLGHVWRLNRLLSPLLARAEFEVGDALERRGIL